MSEVGKVAEQLQIWSDSGSHPDEWLLKEWAQRLRNATKPIQCANCGNKEHFLYAEEGGSVKQTIAWHKDCLMNMQSHLLRELEAVRRANEACDRTCRDIMALDAQIVEAEIRGLDGFNREKFGKQRKAKAAAA